MVRPFPSHHDTTTSHLTSLPLAIGLFGSLVALVALCVRRPRSPQSSFENDLYEPPSKSPLATPKRILTSIKPNINSPNKKSSQQGDHDHDDRNLNHDQRVGDEFGEGGLWQKNILMGEKCQPLEFSGVIYYDNSGNRVSEIPRSPRASAANGLQGSFSFPVPGHR